MYENAKRKYAVVDLEATSAGSNAAIIQVGIVIIENDEIVKTYSTDVNPHQALEDNIIQLTGITDEQLETAPDFSQVAREIFELIEDCVFVAHNVKFDANLLAEQLFFEGYELRTPRVDTVELSQVFYPSLEKYGLGYLAEVLDLDLSQAHTAISDAYATAQLFLQLKAKIESLPKGIKSNLLKVIEEDGIDLSGGEKQKLALARALYKGAPVIVLDEPTSALDALAEQRLYESFDEMIGDKSAVYISHRLASTRFCDRIAMFKQGEMVEYGSHDELMERQGEYASMFMVQAQYYQEEQGEETDA